ncbi:MAG: sigma-70 family RNA polymerase sigma factor [Clostridia bacterium]|nr:sigma-70 family RNA polymerase sigma factor [Clostridia bacterium]
MSETVQKKERVYDKNIALLKAYREGDRAAGERLVELNRPLIYRIVARFCGRYNDAEELVEVGSIGLVKAINTFDFSRECAFSTYAVPLIMGEIRRFLRDDGPIKVSREEKRLCALLTAKREKMLALGLRPTVEELAASVGISASDAAAALSSCGAVRSLSEPIGGEEELSLESTVYDEEAEARFFDKLSLRMAMEQLAEEQRRLILLRYFRDYSQQRTAEILGITQVKVSREEKKILERLRAALV